MEYLFSIDGFPPCWFFNFNETYEIKFKLNCRTIDSDDQPVRLSATQLSGYNYTDVISREDIEDKQDVMQIRADKMMVVFDFQDWLFISNRHRFTKEVKDV
jgi:hypothetical protein